jgi:tetratricopeptide (TPR) repeat protein
VVRGSYQRMSDRLRITPTLLEVATSEPIAVGKVDGRWEEVFALQDRVVTELIAALSMNLDSSAIERVAPPETLQLEAYEHYAQGRKKFYDLEKDSLEEARRHFEKAIALDPRYAVAHSALGATYAMQFIHRTDPGDLAQAIAHSERALELDPELAEPYPYLCYAYMRKGKSEDAIRAGQKGVERQPDSVHAHYFLAAAYMANGDTNPQAHISAIYHFPEAARLEPRWTPTWVCLAQMAILAGAYEQADRFAKQALELERSGKSMGRFPGSEMFLGTTALRRGDFRTAREHYQAGVDDVAATNHMYRETFLALGACGMGDVELRLGRAEAALREFRRAWNIAREFPRVLGNGRVLARSLSGMSAAYAACGDGDRAAQLAGEASARTEEICLQSESWVWHASAAEMHYALAVTYIRLGRLGSACDALERAVASGWRDHAWLVSDPEMMPLREERRFLALVERLRSEPGLEFERSSALPAS